MLDERVDRKQKAFAQNGAPRRAPSAAPLIPEKTGRHWDIKRGVY